MKITSHDHGDFLETKLEGRLDAYWVDHFRSSIQATVREGHHHIRLDMSGVEYLSSAGIGVLLQCYNELKAIDGSLIVSNASEFVSEILRMTGIGKILESAGPETPRSKAEVAKSGVIQLPGAVLEMHPCSADATVICRVFAEASPFAETVRCRKYGFTPAAFGIGVGAPGRDFNDCRGSLGEFVAAAGCVAYLPTSGGRMADYVLSADRFVPELHTISSIVCEGGFSQLIRFEATGGATISLETLVEASLQSLQTNMAAIVLVGEAEGLVGAALRKSPALMESNVRPTDFPRVREWLAFTSERAFPHCMTLIVGIAVSAGGSELDPLVRPIGRSDGPRGHFHAAAFPYRPLPKGRIGFEETVRRLFESANPLGVLHLLNDDREAVGNGQTELRRGACWIVPIASVVREER